MLVSGLLLLACSVEGEDVATTFFESANNTTPPSSATEGETESNETEQPQTSDAETDSDSNPATSASETDDPPDTDSTGGNPVDEQPDSGQYSECTTVADCIGQNTCVIVPGATAGFCSVTGCTDPASCQPNPGATATSTPACVDDGNGNQVCALQCAGGTTCPGGMECLPLGATVVCV